jgi:addiction module HigA family antidote
MNKKLAPIHPGEILLEDYLMPAGISANALATAMRVPATRINEIVHGRRGITAETAVRLARALGTTPGFWMNLQSHYDLEMVADQRGAEIEEDVRPLVRVSALLKGRGRRRRDVRGKT